jgi:tRNA(Ile)-lysidine synthase
MMVGKPTERLLRSVGAALARTGVRRDAKVLLALSGGRDSVALFHAMLSLRERLGYRIAAAHLNHQIRGGESDRDEVFVRDLCARREIELFTARAEGLSSDTPNLEERARESRHAFLNATADRVGADYIAIAHHADDQAETVLMRLLRGAGASGLSAMAEQGPGRLIRPLLDVTRDEVTAYLKTIGESFVNDSSNQSSAMLRNRIRADLMPLLERNYAPGLPSRLVQLAAEMRALDDFVSTAARRELESGVSEKGLDISRFMRLHPALQAELLRQYVKNVAGGLRGIERTHIEAIRRLCLDGPPNGSLDIPGLRLQREYGMLRVSAPEPGLAVPFMIRLKEGLVEIAEAGFVFVTTPSSRDAAVAPHSKFEAFFDGGEGELTVRNFGPGDRIAPLGMTGRRKIQDVFVDHKMAIGRRASFPIVEQKGVIAWLPGIVRGRVGLVTEASEKVLCVRASETAISRH